MDSIISTTGFTCPACFDFRGDQDSIAHHLETTCAMGLPNVNKDILVAFEEIPTRSQHDIYLGSSKKPEETSTSFTFRNQRSEMNLDASSKAPKMLQTLITGILGENRDRYSKIRKCHPGRVFSIASKPSSLLITIADILASDPTVKEAVLVDSSTEFIGSQRADLGWGCAYRNMMMLMSYIRKKRSNEYHCALGNRNVDIYTLQMAIEQGWNRGLDPEGRVQLRGRLTGTKKWIGPTEVWVALTSTVVDFGPTQDAFTTQNALLSYVESYFCQYTRKRGSQISTVTTSNLPPLFLQHFGHSRTIVGYEIGRKGQRTLLVFDPSHKPSKKVINFVEGRSVRDDSMTDGLNPFRLSPVDIKKHSEYQILKHVQSCNIYANPEG
ncbi:Zinc finger with UFM1-specific peptidase domain protein [Neolecta irregularis DAH-3]|uniref:Zinc finger with UFM1-specific peptidase domain protein n=1 Tax=Neolecta irregularis (strain DAH-3) TaxID=1198029 RepID=A0A1U7LQK7_NEOID|nr:Zinc finger with UFM1-specific peptidase domain protein [Neolecta irregularis DAH-3]|eukprot:OLL24924.1 Zinc finger with UFM1-specific peptidase domain protein [Neolecta irregularis DAH-3]